MSRFKAILVGLLSFGLSSVLVGMEKEQKLIKFKYSNPYFDPELQKTLLLLMQKNNDTEDEELSLSKDVVKVIAKKNYDLHCDKVPFVGLGSILPLLLNRKHRIAQFQGADISLNDFHLMSMNKEGRDIFCDLISCIPMASPYQDDLTYKSANEYGYSYELKTNRIKGFLSQDDYNKVLDLPLALRRKVGKLCPVKVIERTISPIDFAETVDLDFISPLIGFCILIGGTMGVTAGVKFKEFSCENVQKGYLIGTLSTGVGITFILAGLFKVKEFNALKEHGFKIKLGDKPLITSVEQEIIKKAEKEAQEKAEQRAQEKELAKFINKSLVKTPKIKPFELSSAKKLSKTVQRDRINLKNRE
ncbi:MAG TPA: hypothetical protein VHX42_05030 [Candidatus Babeliales bacterium]|jgi:hypothetical protein|nr:hypothetical protein [Candidatus Babeliales bacterium]